MLLKFGASNCFAPFGPPLMRSSSDLLCPFGPPFDATPHFVAPFGPPLRTSGCATDFEVPNFRMPSHRTESSEGSRVG